MVSMWSSKNLGYSWEVWNILEIYLNYTWIILEYTWLSLALLFVSIQYHITPLRGIEEMKQHKMCQAIVQIGDNQIWMISCNIELA